MKKVTIKNSQNEILQTPKFEDDGVMNEWINMIAINHTFGKPAYDEVVLDQMGNPTETTIHHDAEYIVEIVDISEEYAIEQRIKSLVASGDPDESVCKKCANLIRGLNKEHVLTTLQITAMIQTFAQIDFCIDKGMPKTLKPLIVALTPDETIVTTEMKTLLLEILKEY